jgi:hypothetical protein
MKETVRGFERRTRLAYDPPAALRSAARPLASGEACPTLFRYPGPEGLRDHLEGTPGRLAPSESPWLWLTPRAARRQRGLRLFGVVAVLQPLRLQPCRAPRQDAYLGVNRELTADDGALWVPPSALAAPVPWHRMREPDQARRRLGHGYVGERDAVREALGAYLEELSTLARAGATDPGRPWCELPAAERRRLLDRLGVRSRWTPR